MGKGVKLYAGEGVAPRGVVDLDDATQGEMQNLKITVRQPYMIVRLGYSGAHCAHKGTKSSKEISTYLQDYFQQRFTWLIPLRSIKLYLVFVPAWAASNAILRLLKSSVIAPSTAVVGGLAAVGAVVFATLMAVELLRLAWSVRKFGCSSLHVKTVPGLLRCSMMTSLLAPLLACLPVAIAIAIFQVM
jgi:hypothetical protein